MSLTDAEVVRIKYELGFNVLTIGAVPYIGITQLFEQVIQPYMSAGASTTSSTTVAAVTTATPATLVLASGTGFESGARIVVDVDDRQEIVTAQNVSGANLTALFKLAHSGTYPVTVEGGESILRDVLGKLRTVHNQIASATGTAGLKRVDVIEFFGDSVETSQTATLNRALMHWRDELASLLGVPNGWRMKRQAGLSLANY